MTVPRTLADLWVEVRGAIWVFVAFAGVVILLSAGHHQSLVTRPVVFGLQAFGVVILGTWLAVAIVRPGSRPTTPLLLPVLIATAAYALSALLSQRPRLSMESTLGGVALSLAFLFLTRLLADPWIRRRAGVVFVTIVVAMAGAYVGQVVVNWLDWWSLIGRFSIPPLRPSWAGLTFGSPNVVATFFLLAGPLAVAMLWTMTPRRLPALVVASVVAAALFLTGSRGAYLGVALGIGAFAALSITRERLAGLRRSANATLPRRPIFVLGVVAATLGFVVLLPAVLYRFGTGGESVRLDLWRSAIDIFTQHPLTGGGPGTWVQLKLEANPPGAPNYVFNNAHNMYLQAAAELGLLGLASMALVGGAVWRRLLQARAEHADRTLRLQTVAAITGIVAFGGQLTVENQMRLPAICLLLVIVVAWVDAGLPPREGPPRHWPGSKAWRALRAGRLLPAVGLVGVLAATPTLVSIDLASNASSGGHSVATNGDWSAALAYYDIAKAGDPDFTVYDVERASALARLGRTGEARDLLAKVVSLDPIAIHQVGLAALNLELGDRTAAVALAGNALALGVGEPTIALNAGLIAERIGDREMALEGFARALAWAPSIAGDALWSARERMVTKGEVVARARALSTPLDGALIAAYAGETDVARSELLLLPPSGTRDIYLAVTDWLAGDVDVAKRTLAARVESNPLDWTSAAWLSRIARLSGDYDTAYRYARWAVAVQGDTAPSILFEEAIVPGTSEAARTAGVPRGYPSAVYLRETPPYIPMPQLTLVGVR